MIGDFLAKAAVAAVALVTMASCGKRTELSVSGHDETSDLKVTEKKNVKDADRSTGVAPVLPSSDKQPSS